MQIVNRVGFLNKSEDNQDSYCPRLEDEPLPEHVGFKAEIPRWIEPQHYKDIRRDHKEIYDKKIHDKMIYGNLGENSPLHL